LTGQNLKRNCHTWTQNQQKKPPQEDVPVVNVDSQGVDRRDDRVNPDVELVAAHQKRFVDEFLDERPLRIQIDFGHGFHLDVSVVVVLLHETDVRVLGRVRQEVLLVLGQLERGRDVPESGDRQIDFVGDVTAAGKVVDSLVRPQIVQPRIQLPERIVVGPQQIPVRRVRVVLVAEPVQNLEHVSQMPALHVLPVNPVRFMAVGSGDLIRFLQFVEAHSALVGGDH
jgi:hypothetical protein